MFVIVHSEGCLRDLYQFNCWGPTRTSMDDNVEVDESASQAGRQSDVLSASSSRQSVLRQQRAVLDAELALEQERRAIEFEETKLQQRKRQYELKTRLAKVTAEEEAISLSSGACRRRSRCHK